jgi:hypothetical protein
LEARNQPALVGLSISAMLPIQVATPAIAAVGIEEPGAASVSSLTSTNAAVHATGLSGAASAPGLTIAAEVASPTSAIVTVFLGSSVEIEVVSFATRVAAQMTPPATTTGGVGAAEAFAVHRPAVDSDNPESTSSGVVPRPAATQAVTVPPTTTPITPPTSTSAATTAATPTAVTGISVTPTTTPTTTPAASATSAATTAFVVVPQPTTLTTGQTAGGGGTAVVPATFVGPATAVVLPPAAAAATGVPAGVAQAEVNPATERPPIAGGDTPAEAAAAPAAEKAEEAPAKSSRLPAIIAAAAAVLYGVWHWRPRATHATRVPQLSRRGTVDRV